MAEKSPLSKLRGLLVEQGFYQKQPSRLLLEMSFKLCLAAGGMYVFAVSSNLLVKIAAIIVSTAGSIGVGTSAHTASHYAASERRWLNEWITFFGFPFFLGYSATYWWNQHITIHHPSPNVIGVDFDADLSPWFAVTEEDLAKSKGLRRFYYTKIQWFAFPLALALYGFQTQRRGLGYLLRILFDEKRRKRTHVIDLAALSIHFFLTMAVPWYYF